MDNLKNLFDEDTVENISNLVEDKMHLLNSIPAFREKDHTLAVETEKFEDSLSKDQNDNFNSIMKLHYQIDSYYFALAYFLGKKHSEHFFK